MKTITILSVIFAILVACTPGAAAPTPQLEAEPVAVNGGSQKVQVADAQLNPYSLEALKARSYGEGELSVEYAWENQAEFTRYYITYTSDGLTIHGFVNVPVGRGPFPVIIALHGYIPASEYETRDYSTRYADAMARNGYIVLHPNMRNFPPSDSVPRTRDYHAGYVVDVLNLLQLVREQAGKEGIFINANMERLGIWGHSLGGGVALRIVGIVPEVKAAVLYAAVTQRYSNATAGFTVFDLPASQAAFSLHHGEDDETVNPSGTATLYRQLQEMGKAVEYFTYPGQPHTLYSQGQADPLFIRRYVDFFNLHLKGE